MGDKPEVICRKKRGRMRLTILRKIGKYGPYDSALVYRYVKTGEENGVPTFEETHWMDEQDVPNSRRLHDIADEMIGEAKESDAADLKQQEAA